tara:strand:+ start:1735 stop:4917 length:3183 start_codon:yes stop_codon:yes gene_type:complete
MTLFTEKSLNLMPSQALTGLSNALIVDKSSKEVKLATANSKIAKLDGTATLRTPVSGRVSVGGGGTPSAAKQQESMAAPAKSTANSASLLNDSTANPGGAPVFVPGTVPAATTSQDVDDMSAEVNSYYESTGSTPSPITATQIANAQITVAALLIEVKELTDTINLIADILAMRAQGELPNPRLNFSALDVGSLPPSTLEKITTAMDNNERFIQKQIIAPFVENQRVLASLQAQASGSLAGVEPIFDLDFGPPISTDSRFVLSRDGLYYNSRGGTVPTVTPHPVSSTMWDLQYPSNRGGRGLSFTTQDAENTTDSIFDLDENLARENPYVETFIKYDDVTQQFKDDKMSHMTEVSGYITEILANGYTHDDSLVLSYMSQLGAVASVYDNKIRKRERQMTIAAIYGRESFMVTDRQHPLGEGLFFKYEPPTGKAFEYMLQYKDLPDALKSSTFFTLEGGQTVLYNTKTRKVVHSEIPSNVLAKVGKWVEIPRIPLNDFSYLKQSDVPLHAQKNITLFSEDLDTVIAPYQAHYVVAPTDVPNMATDSLAVDPIGLGDWVHRQTSGSLSATTPLYKSLTDDIVTDGLLICYNFLDPDAVTQPSGTLYALNNAAEGSNRLDGKLVAFDKFMVFPSGVGQMFCGGTLFNTHASQSPLWEEVIGSYVRLPNTTKDYATLSPNLPFRGSKPLDNLFYSQEGVSLDFWAYVPRIHSDMTDEHRYRLVFANENSGPVPSNYIAATTQSNSSRGNGLGAGGTNLNRTIGMIMGWRDRGSPQAQNGYTSSGLEFCVAPTVGQNQSYETTPDTGWGHSVCIAERWDASAGTTNDPKNATQVGMFVPPSVLTSSGFGITDVNTGYHHINISFDYLNSKVDFNFDGELLVTSSLADVIGGHGSDTVFPTSVKIDLAGQRDHIFYNDPTVESFLGNTVYDERCTPERVAFPVFTPWIIGGGYTDNMPKIPGTNFKPQGFLGSNTNNTWQYTQKGGSLSSIRIPDTALGGDYPIGQHRPPLSASKGGSGHRIIPRSGLDGFIGSFKIYSRPLNTGEAKSNYDSQKGFFHNILLPSP